MSAANRPQQLEIVARENFSDVTYLLEIYHPLMAVAARRASSSSSCLTRAGNAYPSPLPISTRVAERSRSSFSRRQDDTRDADDVSGGHLALCNGRADGSAEPFQRR